MIVCAVIGFFSLWGLTGAGIGISLVSFLDLLVTFVYARYRYHYHPSVGLLRCSAVQVPLGLLAFAATFLSYHTVAYWLAGAVLFPCQHGRIAPFLPFQYRPDAARQKSFLAPFPP